MARPARRLAHPRHPSAPKTILIVDDNAESRSLLAELLAAHGYVTQQAENGRAALDLIKASPHSPALILLDLDMPVMNGHEFLRQLHGGTRPARPIVIVITGRDPSGVAGALAVLRKPIQIPMLLGLIRQLLEDGSEHNGASLP